MEMQVAILVFLACLPCSLAFPIGGSGVCVDRPDGNYTDPNNCHGYIECKDGFEQKRTCADQFLVFDERRNLCDDPRVVPCGLWTNVTDDIQDKRGYHGGSITVTLDEFSGHSEPEWRILSSNPNYKEIERLLGAARRSGFVYRPQDMPARLGFKGFVVEDTIKKPQKELIIGPNTVQLQLLLLQAMPEGLVPRQIRRHIEKEIRSGKVTADVGGKRAKRWAPPYYPYYWNVYKDKNNCYNYATTRLTNTFAQPGRGSGRMYAQITAGEVLAAALRDGLWQIFNVPQHQTPAPTGVYHVVALVISPGYDYHWYRLDSTGFWSHKVGPSPVTDRDNSGNPIRDPRYADRADLNKRCLKNYTLVHSNTTRLYGSSSSCLNPYRLACLSQHGSL